MPQRQAERERLLAEVRRIEALLRAALGIVDDAAVPSDQPAAAVPEEARDLRPLAAAEAESPAAEAEPVTDEQAAAPEDELPGWPPLRRVAQGGADFDWGD